MYMLLNSVNDIEKSKKKSIEKALDKKLENDKI